MVVNYAVSENNININHFTLSLMALTTEFMFINMKINGLTQKIFNFKKRKEMGDFNRNIIINCILKWILMGFVCNSERVS